MESSSASSSVGGWGDCGGEERRGKCCEFKPCLSSRFVVVFPPVFGKWICWSRTNTAAEHRPRFVPSPLCKGESDFSFLSPLSLALSPKLFNESRPLVSSLHCPLLAAVLVSSSRLPGKISGSGLTCRRTCFRSITQCTSLTLYFPASRSHFPHPPQRKPACRATSARQRLPA